MTGFIFSKNSYTDTSSVRTTAPGSSTSFSSWRHFSPFPITISSSSGNVLIVVSMAGDFTRDFGNYNDPTYLSGIEFYPIITDSSFSTLDGDLPSGMKSWSNGHRINLSSGFTQGSWVELPPPQNTMIEVFENVPKDVDLYVHICARSRGYNTPIISRTLFTMPV